VLLKKCSYQAVACEWGACSAERPDLVWSAGQQEAIRPDMHDTWAQEAEMS
jgi:hypothetical protein